MPLLPHLVERIIQDAEARGEFERLPGLGKPIPDLDAAYDELWWVRKWIEREGLDPIAELRDERGCPGLAQIFSELREKKPARS